MFHTSPGVLEFMEDAFNALSQSVEQSLEAGSMLDFLIFAFRCQNSIAGLLPYLSLPLGSDKALVPNHHSVSEIIHRSFSCLRSSMLAAASFVYTGCPSVTLPSLSLKQNIKLANWRNIHSWRCKEIHALLTAFITHDRQGFAI